MKSNHVAVFILAMGLMLAVFNGWAQRGRTRDVMKQKLHYAQNVLRGITLADFPLVATNATRLQSLSQSANWEVRPTVEYKNFSRDFRRQAEALALAATRQNVDAAMLAYFQLTVSCVNCHQYMREARLARQGEPLDEEGVF